MQKLCQTFEKNNHMIVFALQVFDYNQLSHILKKQAELYDQIMKQQRPEPEYFRVG